jgi:hypothetical protein
MFWYVSKIPRIIGIRPISACFVVSMSQAQSRVVIQLNRQSMKQKLQQILDLLASGEPVITQVIPLASQISLFLGGKVPVYEGLPF